MVSPRKIVFQNGAGFLEFSTSVEFLSLDANDRAFLDALAALLDKYETKYSALTAQREGPR
jgi:hypothetical protein